MCSYCENEKWLSEYNNGHGIFIQNYFNNPIIIIDHANVYDEIDINYCPKCRKKVRRLRGKIWKMKN